ncbi:hypothetical protein [Halobacteriovorax sp.]|uniref:hypothetical protein n=1 Tax=Halobacteriovorax sp. TaxID=2020862 RepID=UPI00356999E3
MKRIATLLCLTHLFTTSNTLATEKRLISWKVASVGNTIVTNYDVEKFIEETQISDSLKTSLFKKADGNYSKYLDLKRELTNKSFKKATGQLVYSLIMKQDHQRKHYSKRVAFKVTTSEFNDKVYENESKVLASLLDQGMGIVKARAIFGEYLIKNNYPHRDQQSPADVYMNWYNDQSSRIETELLLKEVKKYESYIALKDDKYYNDDYVELQDKYKSLKSEVTEKVHGKKFSHKSLMTLLNKNSDWRIVISDIDNSQVDTASVKDYKKSIELKDRAQTILSNIHGNNWDRTTGYYQKSNELLTKNYSLSQIKDLAKKYTEAYIQNKSNYSSYMSGLIAKLAATTLESSSKEEMKDIAVRINSDLKSAMTEVSNSIEGSNSSNTLEKEVESILKDKINYSSLSDIEQAIANLSIFSIKFQIKKQSFEEVIPVRVSFEKYTSSKAFNGLRDLQKYKWMKKQFKEYVQKELIYSVEYMTIRTGQHEYLTPDEKVELILGSDFR